MALPDGTAARWIMKGVSPPDPSPDLPMPQSLAATRAPQPPQRRVKYLVLGTAPTGEISMSCSNNICRQTW